MRLFAAYVLSCILVAAASGFGAAAQEFTAGELVIAQPWSRATAGGAKVGAGYMTITNKGSAPDRLVGGSLPQAGHLEIHEMKMEDGVMKMRPLVSGLEIKPGETVKLAPGGYHIMFMNLKEPLKQGAKLRGALQFEKAGTVAVEYEVGSIAAKSPGEKRGH